MNITIAIVFLLQQILFHKRVGLSESSKVIPSILSLDDAKVDDAVLIT